MRVSIVVDNQRSWFVPFAEELKCQLQKYASVLMLSSASQIPDGNDVSFFLSCETKVELEILNRSRSNIVVHASELPKGRGMSPMTWQILEGKNRIPITLFEAVEALDAGPVYMRKSINFQGNELLPEMQRVLGSEIVQICREFISEWPNILSTGIAQTGESTFYRKRTSADSALDPQKTIADQFNLLRVVDNQEYPAYFEWMGRCYKLKVEPAE